MDCSLQSSLGAGVLIFERAYGIEVCARTTCMCEPALLQFACAFCLLNLDLHVKLYLCMMTLSHTWLCCVYVVIT